jgi:hypothetical protein
VERGNEEFIGQREASRRFGMSMFVLRQCIRRGALAVYSDPLDRRKKLVHVSDVENLRHPRPMKVRRLEPEAAQ